MISSLANNASHLREFLGMLLFSTLAFLSRLKYFKLTVFEGQVYFVDADCFTRMARVKHLLSEKILIIKNHPFENFPEGIHSHATMLLDWLLVCLTYLTALFCDTDLALDISGLLVGPIAAATCAALLYYLSQKLDLRWCRIPLLAAYLILPPLIWSTTLGRPDHQLLIISLLLPALMMELIRWQEHRFHIPAGILWGLSLWVSLWEPLILFALLLLLNTLMRKKESFYFLIPVFVLVAVSLVIEGIPYSLFQTSQDAYFYNWLSTIGETRPATLLWFLQLGLPLFAIPFVVPKIRNQFVKGKHTRYQMLNLVFLSAFTVACLILTLWQVRWGYLAAATSMLLTFSFFKLFRTRMIQILVLCFYFIPLIGWNIWEINRLQEPLASASLKETASNISGKKGIMAAWWHSPALLYFSNNPIVASSSHQSLAGTLASAEFFTTSNFLRARQILKEKQVRWIVVSNPSHLFQNSYEILQGVVPTQRELPSRNNKKLVLMRLWTSTALPGWLQLRSVNSHYRLYEVIDSN